VVVKKPSGKEAVFLQPLMPQTHNSEHYYGKGYKKPVNTTRKKEVAADDTKG
jgi:hypothetical protein